MPVIAMVLVVMLLGVLLWLLHRNEVEDENRALIQDILWVEQNLHFNLDAVMERLAQLADLAGREGDASVSFVVQGRAVMSNSPEVERILVRDADGRVRRAIPPAEADPDRGGDPDWRTVFTLARTLGREVGTSGNWRRLGFRDSLSV
ncbi:hypothetical protein [Paramagnetospirillum marisnigri]|nr:hypothetical protein [Paramagnetospirillum marisnigri]